MSKHTLRRALLMASMLLISQLEGCFPVIVAGVAAGALVATERRSVGTQADDKTIEIKISGRFGNRLGQGAHVGVTSYNRKVLLTGEVPTLAAKDEAEKIAAGVENVAAVVNELSVEPAPSLATSSGDALISARVKASFVNNSGVFVNSFKVTTERGIVYLMGRVTPREGARAAELAQGVGGVVKVVKVLDYITEDDLKQMTTIQK